MVSLSGFARLMRPVNCTMMGFAVIVGAALASGLKFPTGAWWSLVLSFFTAFTLTGSAMAVNDYYDREIDSVNEPQRPIPSGAVSPRGALILFALLSFFGFSTSFLTNVICLATAVFAWAVMTLYSTRGKRTGFLGNLLVSTCVSIPFIYGAFALGGVLRSSSLLFASMAFLSNTGREVVKGIVDVEGDKKEGIKTIAVSYGGCVTAFVAAALNLAAVLLSFLPIFWNIISLWYIPLIFVSDLGFMVSSLSLLRNYGRENATRIKNLYLLWMGLGLIGFLVGSIKS